MHHHNDSALKLRLDLQGLRAIAVSVVFLAHAGVVGFSGGYIGVDLFFILSGFLITGVLYKEYEASGRLNVLAFYSRRIKRLLPAMVLMIGLTLLASFVLLPSFQAKAQVGSAPFASLWLSNFYFSFNELDYFNELGQNDLFLHTWSLGVEEQFYLIWPFLFLLPTFFLRGRRPAEVNLQRHIVLGLALVFISSLALCLYWTKNSPLLAFYQMPSRAWQFALGALLFFGVYRPEFRRNQAPNKLAGLLLLAIGTVAVALSVHLYNDRMPYPGWAALLPSFGAALIILAGSLIPEKRNPLACGPLVWLGNRSYSLYLWHWPVLLLFEAIYGSLTVELIGAVTLISLVLTEITYRLVERPFWKGRLSYFAPKKIVQCGALVMLVALLGSFHAARQPLVDDGFSDQWRADYPIIYSMPCDSWFVHNKVQPCEFGAEDAEKTVMLLGDSVGAQWFSLIGLPYLQRDWRYIVLTKSSCPMVDHPYFYDRIKQVYTVCEEWREKILERLPEWEPDVVVVGSASTYGFSDQEWISGSQRVWKEIRSTGAQVVVLPGTPTLGIDAPSCIKREVKSRTTDIAGACSRDQSDDEAYRVSELLEVAASDMPNVDVLELNSVVCPSAICSAMTEEGIVVYRDSQHLTDSFVISITPKILPQLPEISVEDPS
ncbi:acyltransferase family protein [Marinobacter sp. F4206]|uniref:acyltransferase family protein n=1 Tax=Marinobacter sp. F4206 TaxID=2861777 RepID=UPI001C6031EB|nr:acyltransferase family protein [Marinobacter sp. F4206]MBW4935563.1 acyltransferase [Marinobacter sp. F4206]